MALLNSTILEHAWLEGSNDFQQRIPNPAITSYANAVENLFSIQNNDLLNEFTGLLNGIIGTYVESKRFENPLRVLFKPAARFGNSERHIAIKYLAAHSDMPSDETLLKLEMPQFSEWWYSVGKPRRYEFSWPRVELERAFAGDGYGFEDLLIGTITQAYSSDAYDEMNIMIQMFAEADQRMGGLYRENLTVAPTSEAGARELLQKIRAVAGRMKFPTMLYNHIDVPVHENGDTLVLWVTPDAMSFIDVYGLATVFQLDKADIKYRIIEIPEFPIPNVYAALTSEDFIYARDIQYGMEPPFYNPGNLTYKYYLHHRELIGVNPAANCVLFTTDAQTAIPTVTMSITGLNLDAQQQLVPVGSTTVIIPILDGTVTSSDQSFINRHIALEPEAVAYSIAASRTVEDETEAIPLNSRTFIDAYNVLHLQKSGLVAGDTITITATTDYINPSGSTSTFTATTDVIIAPAPATPQGAKDCAVSKFPFIQYTDEYEEATASE